MSLADQHAAVLDPVQGRFALRKQRSSPAQWWVMGPLHFKALALKAVDAVAGFRGNAPVKTFWVGAGGDITPEFAGDGEACTFNERWTTRGNNLREIVELVLIYSYHRTLIAGEHFVLKMPLLDVRHLAEWTAAVQEEPTVEEVRGLIDGCVVKAWVLSPLFENGNLMPAYAWDDGGSPAVA